MTSSSTSIRKKRRPLRKSSKRVVFTLNIPSWEADILVVCGGDYATAYKLFIQKLKKRNAVGKEFSEIDEDTPGEFVMGRTLLLKEFRGLGLWFRDKSPGGGVLSHEAFHATHHILSSAGVILNQGSEEAYAYLLMHIVKTIARKVW